MAGPFLLRDCETFVQLESAVNTSPGALAAGDAIKAKTDLGYKRVQARYDRDQDRDGGQASVIDTLPGREKGQYELSGDLTPSGVTGTPTAPDIHVLLEAHFGLQTVATAHTTTHGSTPCTTTVLNLVAGGGAASGIRTGGGDVIAVDCGATHGIEVRRVVSRATDAVTVSPALSAAPGVGAAVYVGTTFNLSQSALKSFHQWGFVNGDNFRHKLGGCIARMLELDFDGSGETPILGWKVSGDSYPVAAQTGTSRPTPTTAGLPLLPSQTKVFMGTSGKLCAVKLGLKSDNGIELRETDACTLTPNGLKRTGNNSRYNVELSLDLLLQTGTIENFFDNAAALTGYDTVFQLGVGPGYMVGICAPKWKPEVQPGQAEGEVALSLAGRCYGTNGDDDLLLAVF